MKLFQYNFIFVFPFFYRIYFVVAGTILDCVSVSLFFLKTLEKVFEVFWKRHSGTGVSSPKFCEFCGDFIQKTWEWLFLYSDCVLWFSEAVSRRCSGKKVFLKISQNSQENTCARVSFLNKVTCLRPAKRDSDTGVFLWILRNFKENFFYRTYPMSACGFLELTVPEEAYIRPYQTSR